VAKQEEPPFARGTTFHDVDGTIDLNNLGGINLEGKEFVFEDNDPRAQPGSSSTRTGRPVRCRIVRNLSATTLFGKYLALQGVTAGKVSSYISGLVAVGATRGFPIDEYLGPAGVRNGDLCYVVIEGPALLRTSLAANAENVINIGDTLVALTAATSGATTAGRVIVRNTTLTNVTAAANFDGSVFANNIQNRIGMALSAATTANTNSDILVDVGKVW
jgi:hypothetical protein